MSFYRKAAQVDKSSLKALEETQAREMLRWHLKYRQNFSNDSRSGGFSAPLSLIH